MAAGYASTSMGFTTTADSYSEVVLGQYNALIGTSTSSWVSTDPVFEVGIGTTTTSTANAMTVYKDGTVALGGTTTFGSELNVNGTSYLNGTTTISGNLIVTGGCSGCTGGSNSAISNLTTALANNSFDNVAYTQTWSWNGLTTGNALVLSTSAVNKGNLLTLNETAADATLNRQGA